MPVPDVPAPVAAVEVRAPRLPPGRGEAAFSVVTLGPERLEQRERLDEALSQVPAVSLFRRTSSLGANPTTQGLSLRAFAPSGAGRALVTLDGVPVNDPFGGWVIWTALPPEALDGVRIVRGAGAGPYGAGALTGVVTLSERTGPPGAAVIDLSAGELGHRRGAGAAELGAAGATVLLAASAERDNGWIPVREGRGAADAPLTLSAWSASARLRTDWGPRIVALRVSGYGEERDSGLVGAASASRGGAFSATVAQPASSGGYGWRAQGWARWSNLQNSSVAVAPGRAAATPANDQFDTPAVGYGVNLALRRSSPAFEWEIGADLRAADGEERERFRFMAGAFTRERRAGGRTLVTGAYAEASRAFGPWLLTGGARLDRWAAADALRIETDTATGQQTLADFAPDRSGVMPTFRLGLRRDAGRLHWRAAAYQGFRPPTLNELHRPFRVGNDITEANPGLEPERLTGAETGLGYAAPALDWNLTLFASRMDDAIANVTIGIGPGTFPLAGFVPAGGTLRQRQNAGRIDAAGIEADLTWRPMSALEARAALGYTRAEVDGGATAPQLTGLRPAQSPELTVTAGLSWRPTDRLSLGADVRYEGARWEDDLNTRRLAPGATLNTQARYRLTPSAEVWLAADNLTDSALETGRTADNVASYGPPRQVRVGISWRR